MTHPLRDTLSSALAHAGHGHTDPNSLLHMLAEPVHAALIAAPAALGVALLWARRGRRSRTERLGSAPRPDAAGPRGSRPAGQPKIR